MENPEHSFSETLRGEAENAKDVEIKALRKENDLLKAQKDALMESHVHLDRRLQEEHDKRMVDALTGLHNEEAFVKKFEELTSISPDVQERRHRSPSTLLMLDLDGFKTVNDTYGYDVGDSVLKQTAAFLENISRQEDFAVRLHGDEFAIIFFNVRPEDLLRHFQTQGDQPSREKTDPEEATLPFKTEIPILKDQATMVPLGVTFSAGLAEILPGAKLPEVKERCVAALHEAKQAGKNTVRIAQSNTIPED